MHGCRHRLQSAAGCWVHENTIKGQCPYVRYGAGGIGKMAHGDCFQPRNYVCKTLKRGA